MGERRYGISLQVFNLISHEWEQLEREKRNSISTSSHVLFCLSYEHSDDDFFDDFEDFRTLSEDFHKVFKGKTIFFEHFPKISKDYRRWLKISEEEPMMFRSHRNTSNYFLRDYVTMANGDLFTSGNNVLFSGVKISCLRAKAHWYFTGVYNYLLFYYLFIYYTDF